MTVNASLSFEQISLVLSGNLASLEELAEAQRPDTPFARFMELY